MKANELRIGNWVKLDLVGTQNQVTQILERGVNCGSIGVLYEMVKPIPITEEWLERFWYERVRMNIPDKYKKEGSNFQIMYDERGFWVQYKYGMKMINHVHQLQNLYFALTGEELQTDETDQKANL